LSGVVCGTSISGRNEKRAARKSASPRLSFYLRDCGEPAVTRPMSLRAPSVGRALKRRATALQIAVVPAVLLPERFRDYAFGGAASLPTARSPAGNRAQVSRGRAAGQSGAIRRASSDAVPYFFSVRIQSTRFLMSASDVVAFGGIGTGPHTPEPPSFTFLMSFAAGARVALVLRRDFLIRRSDDLFVDRVANGAAVFLHQRFGAGVVQRRMCVAGDQRSTSDDRCKYDFHEFSGES
jgi:hypothetical protein